VILTFDPHPAKALAPDRAPPLIQAECDKLDRIAESGVDAVAVRSFDLDYAKLSPAEFIDQTLVEALRAEAVFVGYDFTFGRNRAGDRKSLRDLGVSRGFAVRVVDPVSVEGIVASSTKVREFVLEGRMEGAELVLGRPFAVRGVVETGAGRGSTIGIPTANVRPGGELIPRIGVYAARTELPDGSLIPTVVNVGAAPTFGTRDVVIEAHLLDWSGDLVQQRVGVHFVTRLRDERRFSGPEELVAQIRRDIEQGRDLLAAE
jgi:riboflavin kinase/FMN adenylyltransferase